MPVETLCLSVSSPGSKKKTIDLFVPIELENNCSEDGVVIDSDNLTLTNAIRKHFLEHFGHRDLKAMVGDYAPEAILVVQDQNNSTRAKYHGLNEIEAYFKGVFEMHPVGESSFRLEQITVEQKHATCVWSAKSPKLNVSQGNDTFVFNNDHKIVKQFFSCQTHEREDPGTGRVVRRASENIGKECEAFFKE